MKRIEKIEQCTENPFVNLYNLEVRHKNGKKSRYYVASRARFADQLKLATGENHPDGVVIYALYGEKKDRVVLVRQFRYPLGDYVYELPAGLVEPGEDFHKAAARELQEETGLIFEPLPAGEMYEKPAFTSVGMSDESCATVYGYASGEISREYMEESEDIEVVLADREEVRRILREEKVAIICSYMLMHFLADRGGIFGFPGSR